MNPFPVRSPLRFSERRGVPVFARFPGRSPVRSSRDLPLHGGPSPAALRGALPLLLVVTGCSRVMIAGEPHVALSLPTLILLLLATAVVGLLAGAAIATLQTTSLLRAIDHAANEYHRGEVAKLVRASQQIHDLVDQVIFESNVRIGELQQLFWQLRWRKA